MKLMRTTGHLLLFSFGLLAGSYATSSCAATEEATSARPAVMREIALPSDPRHKLCIPANYQLRDGQVDVLVHFHSSPKRALQNCQTAGLNCVVIGVTYGGLSSVYRVPFRDDPTLFQTLLDEALFKLRAESDFPDDTQWGKVAVSSFSAGFGAVREILKSEKYFDRIDTLYMVDSLYCGYVGDGTKNIEEGIVHPGLMKDFLRYAQASSEGKKTMILTHCDGPTPGYASTRETADYLLEQLKLNPEPVDEIIEVKNLPKPETGPFRLYRKAARKGFSLYGSPGDNVQDHVQHLRHMAYWLRSLPLDKLEPSQQNH